MSTLPSLSAIERESALLRYIEREQRVSVAAICARFAISEATARRALGRLERGGSIRRIHGGAIAVRRAPPELPALERAVEQAEEKRRIGRAAAAMVHDGQTLFLSSGTTTIEIARELRDRSGLTVITNSLPVIALLASAPGVTLIALGGMLRRSEQSLIGHVAELGLAELRADMVFIGIRAIDIDQGLTNDYLPETMTDRAILRIGRQIVVVADHTKCERVAPALVAPVTAMHTLVTDVRAPAGFVGALRERGIQVLQV